LDEETGEVEVLKELIGEEESKGWTEWTMNDGAVDPQGRFWVGECDLKGLSSFLPENAEDLKGKGRGRLWRFDGDGSVKLMQTGLLCGNGIGWSPDGKYSMFVPF
jgi:sugar lactone lactonase YvrE